MLSKPVNLLAALAPLLAFSLASGAPTVDLGYSSYRGVRLSSGVDQFLGMRYASPPLGNLRFRAPQDPIPEASVQDASEFGPVCVGASQTTDATHEEDCLFVNVFAPSNATETSNLPVWVYIVGGAYQIIYDYYFNGTEVVNASGNNIILVNFSYRVGPLGFLAGEKVQEDGDVNAGLLDQRKLLKWVQNNIKKFGGNPDHVVIHGSSAGAGSVAHHLTAYGGKDENLFAAAIHESSWWPTLRTVPDMEFQFDRYVEDAGCSGSDKPMDCLRSSNLTALLAASVPSPFPGGSNLQPPVSYWLPVVDGGLVPGQLHTLFSQGRFRKLPTLVGDDTDEGTYFAANATTAAEVKTFLKSNFPKLDCHQLDKIIAAYPQTPAVSYHAAWFGSAAAAFGDSTLTCPGNKVASTAAQYVSPQKVWNYRYNVQDPGLVAGGLGAAHISETAAIFGVNSGAAPFEYAGLNAPIVPVVMNYWISFIRALDPNVYRALGSPLWQPWGQDGKRRLKFETNDTKMELVPDTLVARCQLWEGLAATMET